MMTTRVTVITSAPVDYDWGYTEEVDTSLATSVIDSLTGDDAYMVRRTGRNVRVVTVPLGYVDIQIARYMSGLYLAIKAATTQATNLRDGAHTRDTGGCG